MGNETVIVDNNTRNNTHIATVGLTMASREKNAYHILRRLDVKYVVIGGFMTFQDTPTDALKPGIIIICFTFDI